MKTVHEGGREGESWGSGARARGYRKARGLSGFYSARRAFVGSLAASGVTCRGCGGVPGAVGWGGWGLLG